jgi:hypothetical protein
MNDQNSKFTVIIPWLILKQLYFSILKKLELPKCRNNLTNTRYAASILLMLLVLVQHNHFVLRILAIIMEDLPLSFKVRIVLFLY